MKTLGNILLLIFLLTFVVIQFYNPSVTSEELSSLSKKAAVSPAATELLKVFLADNPTPKEDDIWKVRKAIEQEATLLTSKQITGDPKVANGPAQKLLAEIRMKKQAEAEQKADQAAFDQHVSNTSFWDLSLKNKARALATTYFRVLVAIALGVFLLTSVMALLLRMRRGC